MIYGICAITFNVVMSYDCMPYMSQVNRLSNKHKIVIENMHDDDSGQYI
jgi:hypothetical protein